MLHMPQKHSNVPQIRQQVEGMYGKKKKYNKEKENIALK